YVAATSQDGKFYLFNTSNLANALIWTYDAPTGNYGTVSISGNGNYIAAVIGYSVYLFDKSSGTPLWTYNTTKSITNVAISFDGNYVVANTRIGDFPSVYGALYFFNTSISPTKTPMWNYTMKTALPLSVAISSDGNYTAVGSYGFPTLESDVYLFNKSISQNKTPIWKYQFGPTGIINEVAMNSNASYIVVADGSGYVYYFKDKSPTRNLLTTLESPVYTIDISPNGRHVITGGANESYYYRNHWTYFHGTMGTDYENVNHVSVSDNGFAIATENDRNYIHSRGGNPISFPLVWYSELSDTITDAKISSDGKYCVIGSSDSNLYLFNNTAPLANNHFRLNIVSDSPNTDGNFSIYWEESTNADNYSIFHSNKKITQINGSLDLIEEGITAPYTIGNQYQISGVTTGTHYYRIVAYNEYGYSVSYSLPYSPVIVSLPPGEFQLSSTADDPDPDGLFNLNWDLSTDANNYSVYEHTNIITEINGSLDLIASGLTVNTLLREGYGEGDYFFIVVAVNEIGTKLSNHIKITVGVTSQSAGGNFWEDLLREGFLIPIIGGIVAGVVGIGFLVIKIKLKKRAEKSD
ncbi:MAG: WD40 repeat domain-containing protein, partial [Promethearchaeota archaeon]